MGRGAPGPLTGMQPAVRRVMRSILGIAAVTAGVLVVVVAAIWYWQERLVWLPPKAAVAQEDVARRIDYTAEDGQTLYGLLVGDPGSAPGTLVAFHGNADLAMWQVPWAQEVERRTGWAVLLAEYRGYGGLPGKPTYDGSRRDGRAAWNAVRRLGVDSSRIAIYGHSLGSAVATELAVEHPPRALILVSPLSSARDVARGMPFFLPLGALWPVVGRVKFDTRAKVAALDAPVWVAHGEHDEVLPVWMGRAVHESARHPAELLILPDAGHNDVVDAGGEAYWQWLIRALGR